MITVGLIKELQFISLVLKTPISLTFYLLYDLNLQIDNNILKLTYHHKTIWIENISDNGMFGIESCDSISRIINCIDNNDDSWTKYRYLEKS